MTPPEQTPAAQLFVSGRVCLLGEHSDWAAGFGLHPGYCLVVGTDQGLAATARQTPDFSVTSPVPDEAGRSSGRTRSMSCPMDLESLLAAAQDDQEFFRYCAGTAYEVLRTCHVQAGLELQIDRMDLPLRKGVSSSAAVCILVAQAFDRVYSLGLFPHELMEMAYRGEILTGSQCGRMDQACIYGKVPVLLSLRKGAEPRVEPLAPGGALRMFIVDLAGKKDTPRILADLQKDYLRSDSLQQALGSENERIVRQGCRLLATGNAQAMGQLMTEAQEIFDDLVAAHCPDELASPLLHDLLADQTLRELTWGAKGVGSQGDGTAQFVARGEKDRQAAMEYIQQKHPQMRCFPLNIGPCEQ